MTDSIAHAVTLRRLVFFLLALFQRERIKVRDRPGGALQALTKLSREHYQVLPGLDDSRTERGQSLVQLEIPPVSGHVSLVVGSHGRNHPVRSQVSRQGNRNPGRTDQSDVVAGIYTPRTFDFEDCAREYARNRSRSCGGNERASLPPCLIASVSCEKRIYGPLPSILSPRVGRGGIT